MLLLAVEWYHYILATLFASVCILMILVILLQRGRGSGLAGAFGGAGGSSHLGAKTGDVLTLVTLGLAVVYASLAISMNWWFLPIGAPAPATPAIAPPPASPDPTDSGGPPAPPFIEESAVIRIDASDDAQRLLFGDPDIWAQPADSAC